MVTAESNGLPVKVVIAPDTTCTIYIPDLSITVHGNDFIDAMSNAACIVTALHYYNKEHAIITNYTTTYDDVMKMCDDDTSSGSFPTYIQLVDEGIYDQT